MNANPPSSMTVLQMIAEWRKGCSCAEADRPEECQACTAALIDAIENHELKRVGGNMLVACDCGAAAGEPCRPWRQR